MDVRGKDESSDEFVSRQLFINPFDLPFIKEVCSTAEYGTEGHSYVRKPQPPNPDCKYLLVRSDLGTGKSFTARSFIREYNSVLIISPRISLSRSLLHTLNTDEDGKRVPLDKEFKIYSEEKHDIQLYPRVIVSLHSLGYVHAGRKDDCLLNFNNEDDDSPPDVGDMYSPYELVIIDEFTSTLKAFSDHGCHKDPVKNFETFENTLLKCKRALLFCADFDLRGLKFLKNLEIQKGDMHFELNRYVARKREMVFFSLDYVSSGGTNKINKVQMAEEYELVSRLEAGESVVFISSSLTRLNDLEILVHRLIENGTLTEDQVKIYSSETKQLDIDPNEEWKNCRLLAYTSTFTVGIDYTRTNHFSTIFVYLQNRGCALPRDMVQAIHRVRCIGNETLKSYDPTAKIYVRLNLTAPRQTLEKLPDLLERREEFMSEFAENRAAVERVVLEHLKSRTPNSDSVIVSGLKQTRLTVPGWYNELKAHNDLETNRSQICSIYVKDFLRLMYGKGYTASLYNKVVSEDVTIPKLSIDNAIPSEEERLAYYNSVESLETHDDYLVLYKESLKKNISDDQKLRLEKFRFDYRYIEEKDKAGFWYYTRDRKHKQQMENLAYEVNFTDPIKLSQQLKHEIRLQTVKAIRELVVYFGLKHSCDTETSIDAELLRSKETVQFLQDLCNKTPGVDGKIRDGEKGPGAVLVNRLLSNWTGSRLKASDGGGHRKVRTYKITADDYPLPKKGTLNAEVEFEDGSKIVEVPSEVVQKEVQKIKVQMKQKNVEEQKTLVQEEVPKIKVQMKKNVEEQKTLVQDEVNVQEIVQMKPRIVLRRNKNSLVVGV
jgi:hypothetical protein